MTTLTVSLSELIPVIAALMDTGATFTSDPVILGSVGSEYGVQIAYEGEGDDMDFMRRFRVNEWAAETGDDSDLTNEYTKEWKVA